MPPLQVQLVNPKTGRAAKVNGEGELNVVVHPHPPIDEEVSSLPFRQYFTDDGTASGSNDMLVDASTTWQTFSITAQPEIDIFIKTVSVVIADASAVLNKFGNIAALSNGIEFKHTAIDSGSTIIAEAITSNFEFVRLAQGNPGFGDGTAAFRAGNVAGNSEGYIPVIDFSAVFGLPWGLRLRKGTGDELVFTIKDNVSALDAFNIIGYGIKL